MKTTLKSLLSIHLIVIFLLALIFAAVPSYGEDKQPVLNFDASAQSFMIAQMDTVGNQAPAPLPPAPARVGAESQELTVIDTKDTVAVEGLPAWAASLAAKFPWLPKVLLWFGIVGGCIRPLCDFLHIVVRKTPSDWDDNILAKVEGNKVFGWILEATKYLTGIKLVHPKA
jgi:hypothetical protein